MKNKYIKKLGKVVCNNCKSEFEKPQSEINRNLKLNRLNYCSRSCLSKQIGGLGFSKIKNLYDISQHSNNAQDEFTIVRYHLKVAKQRNHKIDITLEDLKEQWDKQNGICPYTKYKMIPPLHKGNSKNLKQASLDRIDSNLGYIKGNIEFVCVGINYLKSTFSKEETIDFLNNIV